MVRKWGGRTQGKGAFYTGGESGDFLAFSVPLRSSSGGSFPRSFYPGEKVERREISSLFVSC